MWNRANKNKVAGLARRCPSDGLVYPKEPQQPPFQTREQIEQAVARGGLSEWEIKEQWDRLFLDRVRVAEFIDYIREKRTKWGEETGRKFFHPLMLFLAHTGARVSEGRRAQIEDFDLTARKVRIREKKRSKAGETYRWVDLSPLLTETLRGWFASHAGGNWAFCAVPGRQLTEENTRDAFDWFVKDSKWDVLRGFHVLRHSFASNLAREGIDQRTIDGYMGHQTEAMRARCTTCEKHHQPKAECGYGQAKWKLLSGFPKGAYLYNYQTARQSPGSSVFLVEGPGDVFRLTEAGYTAVASMGTDLSPTQVEKLAALGKEVIVAFDNDPGGGGKRPPRDPPPSRCRSGGGRPPAFA